MNIRCDVIGAGIFSKFMLVLQNIEKDVNLVDDIENIFIKIGNDGIVKDENLNPFEYIFIQNNIKPDIILNCTQVEVFFDTIPLNKLNRMKTIKSKLIFNNDFINKFNNIKNSLSINSNTLGVHIRLTDMNSIHPEFGVHFFDNYLKKIDKEINNYDKIFVASDNNESIFKLKKIYGNLIINYDDFFRTEKEDDNSCKFILTNFSTAKFWESAFIDMLLLAECGALIHRTTNFANAAKIYSNTITKTIFL